MSMVTEAICWDGVHVALGMYVVFRQGQGAAAPEFTFDGISPIKPVKPFRLEDELRVLGGKSILYYEVRLADVPTNLEQYLRLCLRSAFENGAECSWFGFEGSFDFEHLLTEDISDQTYAICGKDGVPKVALEDSALSSDGWRETVSSIRKRLIP